MNVEIVCVGTELLLGDIVNTNAAFLSRELAALGINVYRQTVVGDNSERLEAALREALEKNDMVITSGGLGPTYDDITKETAASIFGLDLEIDESSKEHIEKIVGTNIGKSEISIIKQAYIPKGAEPLKNDCGTAPGIFLEKDGKYIVMLPGPPREMKCMFMNYAVPKLVKISEKTMVSHTVHIFDVGESVIEKKLHKMMTSMTNPTVAPYAKDGEVTVRVTAYADNNSEAENMINPVIKDIKEIIGLENIYGTDVGNLQTALVRELKSKGMKISTAESLTGGLISKRITEVPGSSEVFECGICSYSNRIKNEILGVSKKTLETYTEYSAETAKEMALGVRKISGADIGISSTGIAGPDGGTKEKPVGLVYVGISTENNTYAKELRLGKGFDNERDLIRYTASSHALNLAINELKK